MPGVDDFTPRHGRRYKTLLIDAGAHRGIGVLPERDRHKISARAVTHLPIADLPYPGDMP